LRLRFRRACHQPIGCSARRFTAEEWRRTRRAGVVAAGRSAGRGSWRVVWDRTELRRRRDSGAGASGDRAAEFQYLAARQRNGRQPGDVRYRRQWTGGKWIARQLGGFAPRRRPGRPACGRRFASPFEVSERRDRPRRRRRWFGRHRLQSRVSQRRSAARCRASAGSRAAVDHAGRSLRDGKSVHRQQWE
jgi:hypothetical protein